MMLFPLIFKNWSRSEATQKIERDATKRNLFVIILYENMKKKKLPLLKKTSNLNNFTKLSQQGAIQEMLINCP